MPMVLVAPCAASLSPGATPAAAFLASAACVCRPSRSNACAAWTPESAALAPCNVRRRPSLSCLACCAVLTAVLSALPTVPDSATVKPLCFDSNVSCRVRLS
ncbi:Uncharacterised protein [Achromobacter ruhlandii]|nr:Uncharacterised protein [Achromobacter ruhlandii]